MTTNPSTIDAINGWVSLTAIAVETKYELAAFEQGNCLEGMGLALLNRLKVITALAGHILGYLYAAINLTLKVITCQISLCDYLTTLPLLLLSTLVHFIYCTLAFILTELMLTATPLNWFYVPFCDWINAHTKSSMKGSDELAFEKQLWKVMEQERDLLIRSNMISQEDLQASMPQAIDVLIHYSLLKYIQNLRCVTSADGNDFTFSDRGSENPLFTSSKITGRWAPALKNAIDSYQALDEGQKAQFKHNLLHNKAACEHHSEMAKLLKALGDVKIYIDNHIMGGSAGPDSIQTAQKLMNLEPLNI